MNAQRKVVRSLTAILMTGIHLSTLLAPVPALAVINQATNGLAVDANKVKAAQDSCDSFCDRMISGDGSFRGLDGNSWSEEDDQWCADHGSPTEGAVGPKNPATTRNTCNVPTQNGEDCKEVNQKLLQCKWKNSQAINQCLAYRAASDAGPLDHMVFGLDLTAAAVCGAECATGSSLGGVVPAACKIAGGIAGTTQFAAVLSQKQSPVAKIIQSMMAAAATGTAVGAGADGFDKPFSSTGYDDSVSDNLPDGVQGPIKEKVGDGLMGKGPMSKPAKMACAAAGFFAVLAGIRYFNINNMDNTKKKACEAVQSLASSANVMAPGGQPDVSFKNYTPTNGTANNVNIGGSGGGSTTGLASNSSRAGQTLQCIQNQGINQCMPGGAAGVGATDSGILIQSGLDKLVAPLAQKLDFDEIKRKAQSGATAGGLASSAFGNSMPAHTGKTLANLTQAGFDQASSLIAAAGIGAGTAMASGGGGGRGPAGKSEDPLAGFGNLLGGGGDAGAMAGGNNLTHFVAAPEDIWHTNSTQNIFEIISTKIGKVTNRVQH